MRALVVDGPGKAAVREHPEPRPGPGEELVRVAAASVCATDRKLLARGAPEPLVPGHEFAGHLANGRAVGVHPDIGCGACAACRDGWNNRCPDRVAIGLGRDGGLAELAAVPSSQLVPLDGVPTGVAPFLEPLACCLHAVDRAGARDGDRAVVVGAGPMGLLTMWALQRTGARVAVCQRSPHRRSLVRDLGAHTVVGPEADAEQLARELGGPPRIAVVTPPGTQPLSWALERVAPGGVVHAFAGTPGGAQLDANLVHYRHLTVVGSTGSTLGDYREAVRAATAGLDLSRLPHDRHVLTDLPGLLAAQGERRVVVAPGDPVQG